MKPLCNPLPGQLLKPSSPRECALVIQTLKWVVNHLGSFFGNDIELVLHDLSRPGASVVAIANGHISRRTVGSAIISGPLDDEGLKKLIEGTDEDSYCTIVGDYKTRLVDGRELNSLSLMFRTQKGVAFAALCANADRARLLQLKSLVDGMFADPLPDEALAQDVSVEEMVDKIIDESIASVSSSPQSMTKDERVQAVRAMNNRGLFLIRSSVETAAARLGVTRYTIYNYLDDGK